MEKQILVTNIQRFSLHDGPGIRTTVFCKGCSLRCPLCANPENLVPSPEKYVKEGQEGVYGRYFTCNELYDEAMKDKIFYAQRERTGPLAGIPGGVTFSGGEPLLQIKALEPLLRKFKETCVHLCVETALFVPEELLTCALRYIDLFYVDVKILDADRCKRILDGDLERYEANLSALFASGRPVVLRVPVIGGFTDDDSNRQKVAKLIKRWPPVKVELIKEHNLGKGKYVSLGKSPIELNGVPDSLLQEYENEIEALAAIPVEICRV